MLFKKQKILKAPFKKHSPMALNFKGRSINTIRLTGSESLPPPTHHITSDNGQITKLMVKESMSTLKHKCMKVIGEMTYPSVLVK